MKGDVVPDSHRIARFCRPKHVDGNTVLATAFLPRSGEDYLSVNWIDFLGLPSEAEELRELRALYRRKFEVGARARIALLPVGETRSYVHSRSPDRRQLDVLHEPIAEPAMDASHAGIFNIRDDDELIAELVCQAVTQSYPARD